MSDRITCPFCGGRGTDPDLWDQCIEASCPVCNGDGFAERSDDDYADNDEWECAYPDRCLMAFADHLRSECHTVEDMEAQAEEMRQEQPK